MLQSIVKNDPVVDGNRRLGWVATAVFLEISGVESTTAANNAVYELVKTVPARQLDVEEIAASLPTLIEG